MSSDDDQVAVNLVSCPHFELFKEIRVNDQSWKLHSCLVYEKTFSDTNQLFFLC